MAYRARKSPLRHLIWIVPILALDFFIFRWLALRQGGCSTMSSLPPGDALPSLVETLPPPPPSVWHGMVPPTAQTNLLNPDEPGVLMPTGSGRLESAKFGSTRTVKQGKGYAASFHEGVDIAPVLRDRNGVALDKVVTVADGRVAFINSVSGNSSYGKYVVVEHADKSLGVISKRDAKPEPAVVYTLYAHLADIRFGIRVGSEIKAGTEIGTMGASSNTQPPIPISRSHLHWEIGLMLNARYDVLMREQKTQNLFAAYNGNNLFGFDPLDFVAARANNSNLDMAKYIATVPVAFEAIIRGKFPDYFRRYPFLWAGPAHDGGAIRIEVSESGAILSGRNADSKELQLLGNKRQAVARASGDVLGRNGRRLVALSNGQWDFTERGKQWLEILLY